MRPIPASHRREIERNAYFHVCARKSEGDCKGRTEIHHAFIYAGRQVNRLWAYLPLCKHHHTGDGKNDEYARFLCLRKATEEELKEFPKVDWGQTRRYLNAKYQP